jgi:Uma2 family endonuclease
MERTSGQIQPALLTREQFLRMIDAEVFVGDEHIELVGGRLVVVPPQGPPHTYVSTSLHHRLLQALPGCYVREDKSLDCGAMSVPEPDLVVVRGTPRDFALRHPRGDEAVLVVEVSRSTQAHDRDKALIYAAAGVPVYWLLDIVARRIEEHVEPAGDRYRLVRVLGEDEAIDVPGADVRWRVADLLPPTDSAEHG